MWMTKMGRLSAVAMLLGAVAGQVHTALPPTSVYAPSLDAAFAGAAAVVRVAGLPGELVVTDVAGPEGVAVFGLANRKGGMPNYVGQRTATGSSS